MSSKISLNKPALIVLYGFPGAGKTHFSRQFCEHINAAHVHGDRIRSELFEQARYDKQENDIVTHLMEYMAGEFLNSGVSVVFDINALRLGQRRKLREMALSSHAVPLLVWMQIDTESAFQRVSKRDRRRTDDKLAQPLDGPGFKEQIAPMQNPKNEDYVVISGKHTFNNQRNVVMKKLFDMGLIPTDQATMSMAKPGLVNLVPNAFGGRVDDSRRNIVIR